MQEEQKPKWGTKEWYASIGKRGGDATRDKHGKDYYSKIGTDGGNVIKKTRGPDYFSKIGKIGSKSDKSGWHGRKLVDGYAELSKRLEESDGKE